MTIEYNWKIVQLERTNDEAQGVITAHWTVNAIDGEHTASSYGSTSHQPEPTSNSFVPFDQLTEEVILGWVFEQIDKNAIEASLAEQIATKQNPPTVSGLPWSEPVTEEVIADE